MTSWEWDLVGENKPLRRGRMPRRTAARANAVARAVAPYVYATTQDGGVLVGYQVRFRRRSNGKTENLSRYFATSKAESRREALRQALEWRDRNFSWLVDRAFVPNRRKTVRDLVAERVAKKKRR